MEKQNLKPGPQNKTIAIPAAKVRVKKWLDTCAAMPQFAENTDSIPRAMYVSIEDLQELIARYHDDNLVGIRIYYGMTEGVIEYKQTVTDIRGLIVPVIKTETSALYKDLVQVNGSDPTYTSVYDFTTPCPVYCDVNSELYVPYPGEAI
jgi:hypothetical protein